VPCLVCVSPPAVLLYTRCCTEPCCWRVFSRLPRAPQLHTQMEHPTDVKPVGAIVGDVFLAVVQLGLSEWPCASSPAHLAAPAHGQSWLHVQAQKHRRDERQNSSCTLGVGVLTATGLIPPCSCIHQ
jgi:hypothetical protein